MEDTQIAPVTTTVVASEPTQDLEVPKFAEAVDPEEPVKAPEKQEVLEEIAPTESVEEADEQAVLKKRLNGAISEVEKRNEEAKRFVELQAEFVGSNPELIHSIAAKDPVLANKVINKIWGDKGIKSYKQLMFRAQEEAQLEGLKDSNPEIYEIKKEMLETKAELEAGKVREQEKARKDFFKSKGILENDYDPNFQKLQEALDLVNPDLVKQDYSKALDLAYTIAFNQVQPVITKPEPQTLAVGGGNKPAPLPTQKPNLSEQSNWLADQLNQKLGYNIQLS